MKKPRNLRGLGTNARTDWLSRVRLDNCFLGCESLYPADKLESTTPKLRADYGRTLRTASAERPGFGANPRAADRHAATTETASPRRGGDPAFEVDWEAVSRAQREQNRRHRVFGRDSLLAAAKTFGLLFGAIFLLHLLTSHG